MCDFVLESYGWALEGGTIFTSVWYIICPSKNMLSSVDSSYIPHNVSYLQQTVCLFKRENMLSSADSSYIQQTKILYRLSRQHLLQKQCYPQHRAIPFHSKRCYHQQTAVVEKIDKNYHQQIAVIFIFNTEMLPLVDSSFIQIQSSDRVSLTEKCCLQQTSVIFNRQDSNFSRQHLSFTEKMLSSAARSTIPQRKMLSSVDSIYIQQM